VSSIDTEIRDKRYMSRDEYEDDEQLGKPLYEYVRSLFGITSAVWKERRRLFRRTLTLMAITLGLMFLMPNRYTATAVLTPPNSQPASGIDMLIGAKTNLSSLASSSMGDMLGVASPGQLYIQQMLSRQVQDRLIEQFNLKKVYHTELQEDTRKALTGATNAEENIKSGAVSVSVTDKEPKLAADLANAYAKELGMLVSRVNSDSARNESEYFGKQLEQAKEELQKDTKDLAAFGIQNGMLDTNSESSALTAAVTDIESQIVVTESEIKGLLQIYSPQHERVQQMQAKLVELRRQLQQFRGKGSAEEAKGADTLKDMLSASPTYLDLQRKVKIQESVVETLAQQFELSRLQQVYKVNGIQVFDPALPPERKSSPHRATLTLLIGILFFFAQTVFIIARGHWNSLPMDDPWRTTLLPAVEGMSSACGRISHLYALGDHNFVARWRKRRAEKRVLASKGQR
jgi:tyrosine-protein kinase Etk/Wzc